MFVLIVFNQLCLCCCMFLIVFFCFSIVAVTDVLLKDSLHSRIYIGLECVQVLSYIVGEP